VPVFRGDRLIFSTAGAGGLGDPLTRETERIAADVRAGLVSVEAARSEYGVVVAADGVVDAAATASERERAQAGRGPTEEFDFGPLPPKHELAEQIAEERRSFDAWMTNESRSHGGVTAGAG
jgi:N-methylhydantoinase B